MRLLAKFLKVLNSNAELLEISLGLCLAMIAGLTPFMSLHNLVVLFAVLVLKVNLSAFLLGLGLFSGIAYALDPLFHRIGLAVLTAPSLGISGHPSTTPPSGGWNTSIIPSSWEAS
ncbi:MAG: TIGR03546 family protein [Deltaproteobacteria bacterium]|nr:TIGR03546 family protein [Deltaproteobacteria bacterium]